MPSKKKEENPSKARTGYRKGKSKLRHKFTNEEVKRLEQEFKCTPYPDFTTRDELARQFRCELCVIGNWFQNKRSRSSPELKDKIFAIRRMRKRQEVMLTGHQDKQTEEASGEQYGSCDSVVQSIGTRSSGAVENLGATGNGSSFNFRPTNFTLLPVSEQYYVGGQQETIYPTFSLAHYVPSMQAQRQMGCNYSPMFPGQRQSKWEYQQQLQHPQSYQERVVVHQSQRDLGRQVSSFPSEHQDQFDPINKHAAGPQTLFTYQPVFHQMLFWLHGQQWTADSYSLQESGPVNTHPVPWDQSTVHKLQKFTKP